MWAPKPWTFFKFFSLFSQVWLIVIHNSALCVEVKKKTIWQKQQKKKTLYSVANIIHFIWIWLIHLAKRIRLICWKAKFLLDLLSEATQTYQQDRKWSLGHTLDTPAVHSVYVSSLFSPQLFPTPIIMHTSITSGQVEGALKADFWHNPLPRRSTASRLRFSISHKEKRVKRREKRNLPKG